MILTAHATPFSARILSWILGLALQTLVLCDDTDRGDNVESYIVSDHANPADRESNMRGERELAEAGWHDQPRPPSGGAWSPVTPEDGT